MKVPEYITIKNNLGKTRAYINPEVDKIKDAEVGTQLNSSSSLTFSIPCTSKKLQEITPECKIYPDNGREYVLLGEECMDYIRDDKGSLWAKVMAQESWKLLDREFLTVRNDSPSTASHLHTVKILSGGIDLSDGHYTVGSAGHALYGLLANNDWGGKTPWTVGIVDVTGTYDLETEKENLLNNIRKIQELWGGYLVWDSINKTVSLRDENTWQNYSGFQIRYAKNLKNMTRTQSNRIVTRLYAYGKDDLNFADINGGNEYIDNTSYTSTIYKDILVNNDISTQSELLTWATKELAKICKPQYNYKGKFLDLRTLPEYSHEDFSIGDIVDIIDSGIGANEKQRVIRHKYKVFQPWDCEVELGIPSLKLAVTIAENTKATDKINTITNNSNQVTSSYLADAAVTTRALANLSVDVDKLANLAVTASKIVDGSIVMPKLGDAAVASQKIADLAVTGQKIALLAVGTGHIQDAGITNAKIANLAVDTAKIADASITSLKVANAAIGSAAIATAAIGTAHIATGVILTAHIGDAQITNAKIDSVSANKITAGTITASVSMQSPIIYGGAIIGSSINIGNDAFKVDSNGNVTATNASITGGSITSNSTINVVTNATIGKILNINDGLNGGIQFGGANVLYLDTNAMILTANGKGLKLYGSSLTFDNGSGQSHDVLTTASTIYAKFA